MVITNASFTQGYEIRACTTMKDGKLNAEPIPDNVREKLGINIENIYNISITKAAQ